MEDAPNIRAVLVEIVQLVDPDCTILEASDLDQAFALVQAHTFNLVISDWNVPDENEGLLLLRRLRQNKGTCPVLFVCSSRPPEQVLEAENLGIIGFINKPFNIEDLTKALKCAA
jgi:DNA-binding response OmpR family regulator